MRVLAGIAVSFLLLLAGCAPEPDKEELCESAKRAIAEFEECKISGDCNPSIEKSIKWAAAEIHIQTCKKAGGTGIACLMDQTVIRHLMSEAGG